IEINHLIERFLSMEKGYRHYGSSKDIFKGIQNLKEKWHNLEHGIIEYQETHSAQIKKRIIEESEKCWEAADAVVLMAQLTTENKVASIKIFYIILILNAITAILVILLVFIYVRIKLEHESLHDPLTHINNRRAFENTIDSEVARSKRYNTPMSLVLLDIDNFKNINDNYGHNIGDKVLIELAKVLKEFIRKSDAVFRIGGEEFAIIIPETRVVGALKLSEKVRDRVDNYSFESVSNVTISLGVAEFNRNITKDELFENADQALYLAKNRGRNRAEVFTKSKIHT
ncbi:MAG: GGDEF domain-containing protein, partial [Deltaproteobacteria bacterium]|nr:GGDEF domain-containing protein [Deltaproteobacteria bacterium]